MNRRAWALILTLIVGGVVLQIPAHSGMETLDDADADAASDARSDILSDVEPWTKRVDLEVTRMT